MGKLRVYELAKELSMESREVIRRLGKMGCDVKNHMSTVEDKYANDLREMVKPGPGRNIVPPVPTVHKPAEIRPGDRPRTDAPGPAGPMRPEQRPPVQGQGPRPPFQEGQRPPYQGQGQGPRPPFQEGQRPPYQGQGQGPRPPFQEGQRPPYQGQGQGPRPPFQEGQRPPYQGQGQGPRPPFQEGQRPPYQGQGQGPRPPFQEGQRPPYQGQGQGPRPPFQEGQRPPYQGQGPRPPFQEGQRPPYQGQGQGPRPPFQEGQRPPYQGQGQGPRPPFQEGQRPPYQGQGQGPRPPFQEGQRPPYQGQGQGPRPPYQGQGQGPRPPYQGQGQGPRPPYQGQGQGQRPPYQGQGDGQRPPYQGQGQGQRPPFQGQRPAAPIVIDKPLEKNPPGAKRPFKPDLTKKKPSEGTDARTKARKAGEFHSGDGEFRGRGPRGRGKQRPKMEIPPAIPKKVVIGETVTVQELAKGMGKTAAEVIKKLFTQGIMATINQELDSDTAVLLADEFGVPVEVRLDKTMEMMEDQVEDESEDLVDRPPIVTVMGHVDHGKTSLLDAIRKANVIATEAGGITQHIGAYQVELPNGKKITFLDTPGHEAFTAMRARGAQVTDIAILVVAADDGVMPQTIEAINHAKAAKVPIIVAINKIDKPGADAKKVKQELTEHGVVSEEWGGETVMVPLSAKTQEGIPHLLEMILLVAEVAELKSNPKRMARGTVVEAQLDKGRGPVATVLVQKGTLKIGDMVVAGSTFGKVKAMIDDKGRRIKTAGPSTPVEVLGFSEAPPAGEIFVAVADDKDARYIAGKYQVKRREEEMHKTSRVSLDDLFKHIADGEIKELNIVIKADVQGSIEALAASLNKLSTGEVRVNIIHSGVGTITESDVMLASASNAIIIGFNVRPDANTRKALETEKIDLRLYRVIYDAIDDIKAAMTGLLDPTYKEVVIGRAEVRTTFKVPKIGTVAGCYLTEGRFTRQAQVRVIREGIVVHEGKIESLRRFKDDVKEVASGFEFGLGIEKLNDLKELDIVEAFIMEELKRQL